MNHPHKLSRKKLRDENERLKKQLLSAQLLTGVVAQASAFQIATLKASLCSKQITENGGTIKNQSGDLAGVYGVYESKENDILKIISARVIDTRRLNAEISTTRSSQKIQLQGCENGNH